MIALAAALILAGTPAPKATPSAAATPHVPTRQEIEKIEALDKAAQTLEALAAQAEALSKQQYADCLKAIGRIPFCNCIHENLGTGVSFDLYVVSNTHPDIEGVDPALKQSAWTTRDKCAGK